ncbi:MAG: hypothetical protein IPK19_13475 [Chloroflexi bacterium]|nr:hypothetical protein [Chloroflexota bacterium]
MFSRRTALIAFIAAVTLLTVLAFPAAAQEGDVFAAVQDGQVWLYGVEGQPINISEAGGEEMPQTYTQVVASPDGRWIAMAGYTADNRYVLFLYDRQTGDLLPRASGLAAGYPVTFSADSSRLIFAVTNPAPQEGQDAQIDIHLLPLPPGEPTIVTVPSGVGCGGGSPLPTDQLYSAETGGLGGFALTLALTPSGLVYSRDCTGTQIALVDLETEETTDIPGLSHAAVSPDGTQLAGISIQPGAPWPMAITVVDVATGDRRDIPLDVVPDQVAWSADGGSILYTVRAFDSGLSFEGEGRERLDAFLGEGAPVQVWQASLHRLDPASGETLEIFSTPGHSIGRILPTRQGVYVSVVPNLEAWAQAVAEGSLDPAAAPDGGLSLVPVTLYRVIDRDPSGEVVAENVRLAAMVG